ncbi:DUF975 family protein [Pradoshia eiseniae]|nr:DUF975 family protein [Pradoshia eiseniae]
MKTSTYKTAAKSALNGKWGIAIGVFFLYFIISSILGVPENEWIFYVLMFLISGPLYIGYQWFHLELIRYNNPGVSTLFSGFTQNYLRNVAAYFMVNIFTILWLLLLIVPGIIKALAYSMTYFILRDRPEVSIFQAITESRRMMDGQKKKLFILILSFLPWVIIPSALIIIGLIAIFFTASDPILFLVGTVSLIIGLIANIGISIYLMPYFTTTLAVFYASNVPTSDPSLEPLLTDENPNLVEPTQ